MDKKLLKGIKTITSIIIENGWGLNGCLIIGAYNVFDDDYGINEIVETLRNFGYHVNIIDDNLSILKITDGAYLDKLTPVEVMAALDNEGLEGEIIEPGVYRISHKE